jgi:hypothetical protein
MSKPMRGVVCCGELKRGCGWVGLGWSDKQLFLGWAWVS